MAAVGVELAFEGPLDLRRTFGLLVADRRDPTQRVARAELARATRTPDGAATLRATLAREGCARVEAWGPGADWVVERAADLLGVSAPYPDPEVVLGPPGSPLALRDLARRAHGVRLARTHRVVEALALVVLQQKVTGVEAARAFRYLVRAYSEPAPGPFADLWLPLGAAQLRDLPPAAFPKLGVLARQGSLLREIGFRAARLEEADGMGQQDAERRLRALPGLGPWSANQVMLRALGFPDAVPVGDWNLPHTVAYTLAGEERADDARMLELLEPWRGRRGLVVRWIHAAGRMPPRRGPRHVGTWGRS